MKTIAEATFVKALLLSAVMFGLFSNNLFSQQTMVIKFRDGRQQSIPVSDIQTITFSQSASDDVSVIGTGSLKDILLSGRSFEGQATKGSSVWPFSIRFTKYDPASGSITGEVTWKTLNAIHLVEGTLSGNNLNFTETAYVKKGGADLNVSYYLSRNGNRVAGSWSERGESTGRQAWFMIQ